MEIKGNHTYLLEQNDHELINKSNLTNNFIKIKNESIIIYNQFLLHLFYTNKLELKGTSTKSIVKLKGFDFIQPYIEGYKEALKTVEKDIEKYSKERLLKKFNSFKSNINEGFSHLITSSINKQGFNAGYVYYLEDIEFFKEPAFDKDQPFLNFNKLLALYETYFHNLEISPTSINTAKATILSSQAKEELERLETNSNFDKILARRQAKYEPLRQKAIELINPIGAKKTNIHLISKMQPLIILSKYLYLDAKIELESKEQLIINETTSEKIHKNIKEYGFFELEKVKGLSNDNQIELLKLLGEIPYTIAMFEYLGFLQYLMKNHFRTQTERNERLSKWLEVTDRRIKGNINVLNEKSEENRATYTAHNYKEKVKEDYKKLS